MNNKENTVQDSKINKDKEIKLLTAKIEDLKSQNEELRTTLKIEQSKTNQDLPTNINNNQTGMNIDKHLSLKEIQQNFLANEKFKLSVVFIMRAALLAKNINYLKFIKVS